MAITLVALAAATTAISVGVSEKKKSDAKSDAKERAKKAEQERLRADFSKKKLLGAAAGGSARGIGGSNTLLTGSGGLQDPAITGKQTLLGAQ